MWFRLLFLPDRLINWLGCCWQSTNYSCITQLVTGISPFYLFSMGRGLPQSPCFLYHAPPSLRGKELPNHTVKSSYTGYKKKVSRMDFNHRIHFNGFMRISAWLEASLALLPLPESKALGMSTGLLGAVCAVDWLISPRAPTGRCRQGAPEVRQSSCPALPCR